MFKVMDEGIFYFPAFLNEINWGLDSFQKDPAKTNSLYAHELSRRFINEQLLSGLHVINLV